MVKSLEINLEGGKYKATVTYAGSLEIKLKKPKIGNPYFKSMCGEKYEITPDWIKGAVKTNPTGNLLETFTAVQTGRKRAEKENKPAKGFVEKCRNLYQARTTGGFYMDRLTTSKTIHCLACGRKYDFQIVLEHTEPINDWSDWLKILEAYPLKLTKFTSLALRRLAFAQGFETVEKFVEHVNNLWHDYQKLDKMTSKIEKVLGASNAKSRFARDWFKTLQDRWNPAVKEFKRDLKRQLTKRLDQIYHSSNVKFPEETEQEKYP